MEFCSKYAYDYGFNGSDSEEISDEEEDTKQRVMRKVRKADSNIIAVKFDELVMINEMFAGDPIICKSCEAIMSSTSKSNTKFDEATKVRKWTCEFCGEENDITKLVSSLDEIPNNNDTTFLIEPAKQKNEASNQAKSDLGTAVSTDNNYLTFCIDISGSMDTNITIKKQTNPNDTQNAPIYEYQDTSMTRLEGVKVACAENLNKLKTDEPNKRVSLVTFSSDVKFYGDCTKISGNQPLFSTSRSSNYIPRVRAPNRGIVHSIKKATKKALFSQSANSSSDNEEVDANILESKEKMIAAAENQDGDLKSINESFLNFEQKIRSLRTEGSTALGPALTFSIGYCSRAAGSQIILCTDGAANVGMGSVDGFGDIKNAEKFYEEIAEYAKNKGITVNVISMEGTDCKLALLGKVADKTNGTMNIVNPINLGDQFKSILENRIVATEVKAKLIVNKKYLYIRDEELEAAEAKAIEKNNQEAKEALNLVKKSIVSKDIGNANIDTEITFEYGIRKLEKTDTNELKELPFQLQISYTRMDGAKALRVYTKIQEFTKDRSKAESNIQSRELIFSNAAQKMSHQVLSSNIQAAKYRGQQMDRLIAQCSFEAPMEYKSKSKMVKNFSKSKKVVDLNDEEAEEIYKGNKMARSKFSKK